MRQTSIALWPPWHVAIAYVVLCAVYISGLTGSDTMPLRTLVTIGAGALAILAWPFSLYRFARRGLPRRRVGIIPWAALAGLSLLALTRAFGDTRGIAAGAWDVVELAVGLSVFGTMALAADALVQNERVREGVKVSARFWTFLQILYLPIGVFFLHARVQRLAQARGFERDD